MAEETSIREKNTEPIIFQVLSNNNVVDLSGIDHVEMHMMDSKGKAYRYSSSDASPAVIVSSATQGLITYTPPNETIFKYTRTPYKVYMKIYDTSTEHYTVPEAGEEDIIDVRKEF